MWSWPPLCTWESRSNRREGGEGFACKRPVGVHQRHWAGEWEGVCCSCQWYGELEVCTLRRRRRTRCCLLHILSRLSWGLPSLSLLFSSNLIFLLCLKPSLPSSLGRVHLWKVGKLHLSLFHSLFWKSSWREHFFREIVLLNRLLTRLRILG